MSDHVEQIEQLNLEASAQQQPTASGEVVHVEKRSTAARLGVRVGDQLLAVNGTPCQDVIDVQYYAAEDYIELTLKRDGAVITLAGARRMGQPIGAALSPPHL
ncbi:MAG: hypothetical protein HC915_09185 [Anaerolineae bacterium]|nr:hypothetical protein [Anaerolineae bacterium]